MTDPSSGIQAKDARLKIGFVLNPLAGAGGTTAHKGSDSEFIQNAANEGRVELRAAERASRFFEELKDILALVDFVTVPKQMGEQVVVKFTSEYRVVDYQTPEHTHACDTVEVVSLLLKQNIDLILFVGGDGTARDICSVVGTRVPVLGIPSGVKMHSGVFAINPHAASELVRKIILGGLVKVDEQEVRDIDEEAFRAGVVRSQYYGEMMVPYDDQFVQAVKQGGAEPDELALADIAEDVQYRLEEIDHCLLVFSSGSTTQFIQHELGCEATLLGVDVVLNSELVAKDVDSKQLEDIIDQHTGPIKIITTLIGGQGHVFGRGNQQFTPSVLKKVGRDNIWVVATSRKIHALNGRPLRLDTNDAQLDQDWSGLIPVITGYQTQLLYRISY